MNCKSIFKNHYLDIDVILGKNHRTVKELKNLREGAIILLDKCAGEPLDIKIDNEYFAEGEAVIIGDNLGIRVTNILEDTTVSESNDDNIIENSPENTLTQEEINQLLEVVASEDFNPDEYEKSNSSISILIYDFKHPIGLNSYQINAFGRFIQRFCSNIPSIFNQQLSFKLESISQLREYYCYENINLSFIDQWKWYFSDNYIELGFDDFVINKVAGLEKKQNLFSNEELSTLSEKLGTPFISLLSKEINNFTGISDIPEISHIYSAPTYESLLTTSYEESIGSNSHKKEFVSLNLTMYVTIKIKVTSSTQENSSGYIYLNVPVEDLKNFIEKNYYRKTPSDKAPNLDNISINVDAIFGKTRKSISTINGIGEGTLIELDRLAGEPADLRANGITIAHGEIIVVDELLGIKVTEIL